MNFTILQHGTMMLMLHSQEMIISLLITGESFMEFRNYVIRRILNLTSSLCHVDESFFFSSKGFFYFNIIC